MKADATMQALARHIERSHRGHYGGKIETVDLIQDRGWLVPFALGCVVKYATRYQRTKRADDLLKLAHYALMVYQHDHAKANR